MMNSYRILCANFSIMSINLFGIENYITYFGLYNHFINKPQKHVMLYRKIYA